MTDRPLQHLPPSGGTQLRPVSIAPNLHSPVAIVRSVETQHTGTLTAVYLLVTYLKCSPTMRILYRLVCLQSRDINCSFP